MSIPVQHVMPGWESHIPSPLCWCEPRLAYQGKRGRVWSHDAKVCKDGSEHQWSANSPCCARCGASMPIAIVPAAVIWP